MRSFTLQTSKLVERETLGVTVKDSSIPEDCKVSTIAMVGALYLDKISDFDSSELIDAYRLRHFVKFCCKQGIPLSDSLSVDVINLKDNRDFLKETLRYDGVVVCYVPLEAENRPSSVAVQVHSTFFKVSDSLRKFNTPQETWVNRLNESAKKICVSFSATGKEVDVASLPGDSFHCVKLSSSPYAMMSRLLNQVNVNRLPYNSGVTPNYGNFFRWLKEDEKLPLIEAQMSFQIERNYANEIGFNTATSCSQKMAF